MKDISDHGVGLVLNQPFRAAEVFIVAWPDEEERPWFFLGQVRQETPIGGGYWVIGVDLIDVFDDSDPAGIDELQPLIDQLLPA